MESSRRAPPGPQLWSEGPFYSQSRAAIPKFNGKPWPFSYSGLWEVRWGSKLPAAARASSALQVLPAHSWGEQHPETSRAFPPHKGPLVARVPAAALCVRKQAAQPRGSPVCTSACTAVREPCGMRCSTSIGGQEGEAGLWRDAGQPISESAAEPWLRASAPTAGDAAEASAHHRAPSSWGSAAPKEPSPQSTTETFIENSVGQPGAPGPPAAPGTASAEQQPASIQRAHTSTRLL